MRWPGTVSPQYSSVGPFEAFFPLLSSLSSSHTCEKPRAGRPEWQNSLGCLPLCLSHTHARTLGVLLHAPTHVPQRLEARLDVRRDQRPGLVWAGASGSARSRGLQSDTSGCLCRCRPWETAQAPEISGPEGDVTGQDVFPAARLSHACWTCSETC